MGGWDRVKEMLGEEEENLEEMILLCHICCWSAFGLFSRPNWNSGLIISPYSQFGLHKRPCVLALVRLQRNQPLRGRGIGGGGFLWIEGVRGCDTLDLDEAPSLRNNALYRKCSLIAVKCMKRSRVLLVKRPFFLLFTRRFRRPRSFALGWKARKGWKRRPVTPEAKDQQVRWIGCSLDGGRRRSRPPRRSVIKKISFH